MFSKLKTLILGALIVSSSVSFAADSVEQLSEQLSKQMLGLTEAGLSAEVRYGKALQVKAEAEDEMARLISSQKVDYREVYKPNSKTTYIFKAIAALDKVAMIKMDPATRRPVQDTCDLANVTHEVANSDADGKVVSMTGPDQQVQYIMGLICK